ncbi:MAG TPA: serine/threonine-protein kinase, partial [Kofleriaceae bacterium]
AFIAMELLEGEALDQRLHRLGRLSVQEAVRIMRQVASSLGAAHARNIVHRDLKPENIYLVRDPEVPGGERAKILDFGIAKLLGDQAGSMQTQTNAVMGTPVYMSPEQCRGGGGVDARSDVYSLGCVLFTLIAGTPPFAGEAPGDLLVAHMTRPAPRLTSVAPHAPSNVDALIARCMEKDPAARFQNGAELAAALGTLLSSVSDSGVPARVHPAEALTAILPGTTTLGGAASQATGTLPSASGSKTIIVALVALLLVGAAVAFLVLRGGDQNPKVDVAAKPVDDPAPKPAVDPPPQPVPVTQPPPAAPAAPVEPAPIEAKTITVAIQTTPPSAQVFVGDDKKPRGLTPYALELDRRAEPVEVRLVHRGYVAQKHQVDRTDSSKLVVVLEKDKHVARTPTPPSSGSAAPKPPSTGAGGDSDDTMNPFAKKN